MKNLSTERKSPSSRQTVHRPRSDKGRPRLTERDLIVLRRIGEQGAARLDIIQLELAEHSNKDTRVSGMISRTTAREVANRWFTLGLAEWMRPFTYQPGFVYLTAKGLSTVGLNFFSTLRPAESTLHHLHWCFVVRRYLERERPGYRWWSERYLRSEHAEAARARVRSHKLPELPDGHLETPRGIYAVEVELTVKHQSRLDRLVQQRALAYGTVWYFCSPEVKPRVEAAINKLAEKYRQRVSAYDLPHP